MLIVQRMANIIILTNIFDLLEIHYVWLDSVAVMVGLTQQANTSKKQYLTTTVPSETFTKSKSAKAFRIELMD